MPPRRSKTASPPSSFRSTTSSSRPGRRRCSAFRAANAVWAEDRILRFAHSDIGVAVAIDGGLITPVIRNAEAKSLTAISAEMRDLAARARATQAQAERIPGRRKRDLQSRHVRRARIRGHHQSAARDHPGGRRHTPRAVETAEGGVKFISQLTVTLSCDHRVVDGALGAELLAAFKSFIEKPVTALV